MPFVLPPGIPAQTNATLMRLSRARDLLRDECDTPVTSTTRHVKPRYPGITSVAGSGRYSAIRRISLAVFSDTCGNLIQIYQPPGA